MNLTVTATGDLNIHPGGTVNCDAKGFGSGQGPGAGMSHSSGSSGGGHGGNGARGAASATSSSGIAFGLIMNPQDRGSGGGGVSGTGGTGGGMLALTVTGEATINGRISADGGSAFTGGGGGGAGGTIRIAASSLSGSGEVSARGGSGDIPFGGGGGGGRVLVSTRTNSFNGQVSVAGGLGWLNGGAGTIFYMNPLDVTGNGTIVIDNDGIAGGNTPLLGVTLGRPNLIAQGSATVLSDTNIFSILRLGNVLIRSNCAWAASNLEIVASNAVIETTGAIDAAGRGYSTPGQTSNAQTLSGVGAGGGHGGYGGQSSTRANGGNAYGSMSAPVSLGGAGAGASTITGNVGGAGGGALKFTISGSLIVDGTVIADGFAGPLLNTGGGAGGSIQIGVGTLAGSGRISADGGNGNVYPISFYGGGGGAGGRVAIYYETNNFSGQLSAAGGFGGNAGGAGTVYLKQNKQPFPKLVIDNGGSTGTGTPVDVYMIGDLVIQNGAIVVRTNNSAAGVTSMFVGSNSWLIGISPTVQKDLLIQAGGGISFDGLSTSAPGSGTTTGGYGGGGGNGGNGGNASPGGGVGGVAQGSVTQPNNLGGTGGVGLQGNVGGFGGGYLQVSVNGTLELQGMIRANGLTGGTNAGGGAGGSIYVTAGRFVGNGTIAANGGDAGVISGNGRGGGGGGGRIAVYYNTNLFTGTLIAKGGLGYNNGGAGTVFIKANNNSTGQLLIDNGGIIGATTVITPGPNSLTIADGSRVSLSTSPITLPNLLIRSNGLLTSATTNNGSVQLTVTSNLTIEAGGEISVKGRGFTGATSIGRGGSSNAGVTNSYGGGGHGGYGGGGTNGILGGAAHGSSVSANTPGGAGGGYNQSGAWGGGVIQLTVVRNLIVDGVINADGADGPSMGGGGAGGSVNLFAGRISGSGRITANGGVGHPLSGGGGGGRISLVFDTNSLAGTVSAVGGSGYIHGGAGTIVLRTNRLNIGQVIIANNGIHGGVTPITSVSSHEVFVTNAGIASLGGSTTIRGLVVASNSFIVPSGQSATLNANSVTIEKGAAFSFGGVGGATGGAATIGYGGAGHGGVGGVGATGVLPGNAYGSITEPILPGSAAGPISILPSVVAGGGGALRLTVTEKLKLDGTINADGASGIPLGYGGGSGGSVWLTLGEFTGSGSITANGGSGDPTGGGGGGGGRIAVHYATNNFAGTMAAPGGSGWTAGGAGTVFVKATNALHPGSLLVDNNGLVGAYTPVTNILSSPQFTVAGGARVVPVGELTFSGLSVFTNATLIQTNRQTNLSLIVLNDALVEGAITADGIGYSRTNSGPGAGLFDGTGSGGGYGGAGGSSVDGVLGGGTYGSATSPTDRGSRGGVPITTIDASEGGGAVRLQIGGVLSVAGQISANGNSGFLEHSGGGSGGSIWINARRLSGLGSITANGGDGEPSKAGGGGGGRIAISGITDTFAGIVAAKGGKGGAGWNNGQNGSVFFAANNPGLSVVSQTPSGTNATAVSQIDLVFDSPLDFGSVDPSDFTIGTPQGSLIPTSVVAGGQYRVTLKLPQQNAMGDYSVQTGPELRNIYGESMMTPYAGVFTISPLFISGSVNSTNGLPIVGAVIDVNGVAAGETDTNGMYSLALPPAWSGKVSIVQTGISFIPSTRSFTNLVINAVGQNFLGFDSQLLSVSTVNSGTNLLLSLQGIAGITYQPLYSSNLVDWVPFGAPVVGSNELITLSASSTNVPGGFFKFRLSD